MPADYYDLLEVDRGADATELKRAYRRLARQYHPDSNNGDADAENRFKEISEAYAVLSDPQSRSRYDQFGHDGLRGGTGGFDFDLSGIFDSFFGGDPFGARPQSGPRRGDDHQIELRLSFTEAVFGVDKPVEYRAAVVCDECDGEGTAAGTSRAACDACGGSGHTRQVRNSILGQMVTTQPCSRCRATGQVVVDPCEVCRGEGRRTQFVSHVIKVPPGVPNDSMLRVGQQGHAGELGAPPGDLYVHLAVEPHEMFVRDGDNLLAEVSISMYQAALGAEISVETLDGSRTIDVAAGTQPGEVHTMRGLGVPRTSRRGRGDLHFVLRVEVPTKLSEEETAALRDIARQRDEAVASDAHKRKRRKR